MRALTTSFDFTGELSVRMPRSGQVLPHLALSVFLQRRSELDRRGAQGSGLLTRLIQLHSFCSSSFR